MVKKNYESFIDYLFNGNKVKPLHIVFPKTIAYVKSCDRQTKWMYFLIEHNDSLEQFNAIRDKISADIKKKSLFIANNF